MQWCPIGRGQRDLCLAETRALWRHGQFPGEGVAARTGFWSRPDRQQPRLGSHEGRVATGKACRERPQPLLAQRTGLANSDPASPLSPAHVASRTVQNQVHALLPARGLRVTNVHLKPLEALAVRLRIGVWVELRHYLVRLDGEELPEGSSLSAPAHELMVDGTNRRGEGQHRYQ